MQQNSQFFQLPKRDIEQCYPNQPDPTYGNWRKTQAELDAVNGNGDKIINGRKKKQLAKHVGENITIQQFETDLVNCLNAMERCWQLAY